MLTAVSSLVKDGWKALSVFHPKIERHYDAMMAQMMELFPNLRWLYLYNEDAGAGNCAPQDDPHGKSEYPEGYTGFPYRANIKYAKPYLAMLEVVMGAAAGIRRPGSAALDLAYVAAGRTDGFWEIGLAPWDTAAGTLLITEAGGMVGTLTGARYVQGGHIVAGNPKVYAALLEAIRPHVPEDLRSA